MHTTALSFLVLIAVINVCTQVTPYPGMPSRIVLGGLFPLGTAVGAQRASAAMMAVNEINAGGLLSPVVLEIRNADSQGTQVGGLTAALALYYNDSTLLGYVGEGSSAVSLIVQTVAAAFDKCQISYSSTSSELSDKLLYPTFARTVSSDAFQAQAVVRMISAYGWTRVAAIYTKDTYGIDGFAVFNTYCSYANIDILAQVSFSPVVGIPVYDLLTQIQQSGAKIIFSHMLVQYAQSVFVQATQLGMMGPHSGYLWVFTDGTTQTSLFFNQTNASIAEPAISFDSQGSVGTNPLGGHGSLYEAFLKRWAALDPVQYPGAGTTVAPNLYVPYTYDVITTYALTFKRMMDSKILTLNTSGLLIWNWVINTTFPGLTGNVTFNSDGDRLEDFSYLNYVIDPATNTTTFVQFATYDYQTDSCIFNNSVAVIWPDGTHNVPSDGLQIVQFYVSRGLRDAFVIIAAILMAATLVLILLTILYKDNPRIKAATFSFLIYILISALLAYANIFILNVQPVTDFTCVAPLWFGHSAFFLAFSCLFTKTVRVWLIFSRAKKISTKKVVIKDEHLLGFVLLMMILLWVYLAVWTALDKPYPSLVSYNNNPFQDISVCNASGTGWYVALYIVEFILLLVGVFLSFKTRKIELLRFNESSTIAVSIYVLIFLGFIFVPMAYFLSLDPDILFLVQCGGTVVATTTIVVALFFPKFKAILAGKEDATRTTSVSKQQVGDSGPPSSGAGEASNA